MAGRRRAADALPVRRGERGFVLIAVLWLLVLMASIVALMLVRANRTSDRIASERDAYRDAQALESAIQTVMADRMLNGVRSSWWPMPASGTVTIDGQAVSVTLSSEATRIDINDADLARIDDALRGVGTDAAERAALLAEFGTLRAAKRRIGSFAELEALMARHRIAPCRALDFTLASGLTAPASGRPFDAIRALTLSSQGRRRGLVVRTTSGRTVPVIVMSILGDGDCWQS